jgi:hypothetical protein
MASAFRDVDDDEDALFRSLEDEDDDFSAQFRETRLKTLTGAITNLQNMRDYKFGLLTEEIEKEIIAQVSKFKHCVVCVLFAPLIYIRQVSFYKPEFRRCGIMNAHLQSLATKYFSTHLCRILITSSRYEILQDRGGISAIPSRKAQN